jgi:hypothetical protein
MKGRSLLLLAAIALTGAVVLARRSDRRGRRPVLGFDPRTDAQLDEAIKATFPASDPIAIGQIE